MQASGFQQKKNKAGKKKQQVNGDIVFTKQGTFHTIPSLAKRLKAVTDPVIGLQYIWEYRSPSKSVPPHYQCRLCKVQWLQNEMAAHITGWRHCFKYLKHAHAEKIPHEEEQVAKNPANKKEMKAAAAQVEQTEGRGQIKVVNREPADMPVFQDMKSAFPPGPTSLLGPIPGAFHPVSAGRPLGGGYLDTPFEEEFPPRGGMMSDYHGGPGDAHIRSPDRYGPDRMMGSPESMQLLSNSRSMHMGSDGFGMGLQNEDMDRPYSDDLPVNTNRMRSSQGPDSSSTLSTLLRCLDTFRIECEDDAQIVLKITQKLTDVLMEYRLRTISSPERQTGMAVIVRLHGLNIEAGPEDIRNFFHGLPIPEGGVHITGGKMGEAFIIFSSERARQLAMLYSGKQLRGSTVTLYKSSMSEFKNSLELKLRKRKCPPVVNEPQTTQPPPPPTTLEMCTTLYMGLAAMVQELQSKIKMDQELSTPVSTPDAPKSRENSVEKSPIPDQMLPVKNQVTVKGHHVEEQEDGEREVDSCKPGYLRIYGLPHTTTKEEVCHLLKGLRVVDVITDSLQGRDHCCLVKMASFKEAEEGLKYSHSGPTDIPIEVRLAHERMWENAVERYENSPSSSGRSPKRHRSNSPSCNTEYCVMVKNLPKTVTKTEIKGLFSCPDIPNSKVLHLLNKWKERTSTAFIIFTQPEEFTLAMNMNGSVVGSQTIDVSSITMEKMHNLLYKSRYTEPERSLSASTQTRPVLSCIYARNFPAAVRRAEVKEFFSKYDVSEEDIKLLKDKDGNRTGEACIQFGCEERAREARSLHGNHFKQEQILLTCITLQQMKDLLHKTHEHTF